MISDEKIDRYLGNLFGNSEPGAVIHQLLLAASEPGTELSALGVPKLKLSMIAFAPTGKVGFDAESWVTGQARRVIRDMRLAGSTIYFAALVMEIHAVEDDGDEVTENLARRLQADRLLQQHPAVVEVTSLYAACSDGRRWVGEHVLTGRRAGTVIGPQVLTGPCGVDEKREWHRVLRAAVGISPHAGGGRLPAAVS